MEMYCLMALETGYLRSRCQLDWFLLSAMRNNLFSASLLAPDGLMAVCDIPCWWKHLCLHVHMALFLCVFYKDTSCIGLGVYPTPA